VEGGEQTPELSGAQAKAVHPAPEEPPLACGTEGLSPPEQDLPLQGPRRSPWEGLAPGAPPSPLAAVPASAGGRGRAPSGGRPPGVAEKGEMAPWTRVRWVHAAPPHP